MFLSREVTAMAPSLLLLPSAQVQAPAKPRATERYIRAVELQLICVSFSRQLTIPLSVSVMIFF